MDAAFLYPDDRSKIFEETGFVFPGMEQDDMNQIVTVPPLIRQEVTAIHPERVIIFMDIWLIPGLLIAWRVFMRNIRKFL